jgi:two-component system OmpR family response regulator
MIDQYEVIVLQEDVEGSSSPVVHCDEPDLSLRHCTSFSRFIPLHQALPALAVVVMPCRAPALAVTRLRGIDSDLIIIATGVGPDPERRIAVLHAGADACYAAATAQNELAALLHSLHKRLPASPPGAVAPAVGPSWLSVLAPTPPGGGLWRLVDCGQWLACPDGKMLALTTSERVVMARLLAQPGQPLHRDDIASQAWSGDVTDLCPQPRSVDVLISRLRRKAEAQGIYLPLLAVRRWGYMFMGDDTRMKSGASHKRRQYPDGENATPPEPKKQASSPKPKKSAPAESPWSAIDNPTHKPRRAAKTRPSGRESNLHRSG